jgi:hypothetical protein
MGEFKLQRVLTWLWLDGYGNAHIHGCKYRVTSIHDY